MPYSETTPATLAEKVISNIGKDVSYPPVPTDGAQKAARLISQLVGCSSVQRRGPPHAGQSGDRLCGSVFGTDACRQRL